MGWLKVQIAGVIAGVIGAAGIVAGEQQYLSVTQVIAVLAALVMGGYTISYFLLRHWAGEVLATINRVPPEKWFDDVIADLHRIPDKEWFDEIHASVRDGRSFRVDMERRVSFIEGKMDLARGGVTR